MINYKSPESCQIPGLDDIYMKEFGYKSNGFFIDVGAFDGITFSNTWALAEAGWSGLCIEPVPALAYECLRNHYNADHENIQILPYAIGNSIGEVELYIVKDNQPLATINKMVVDTKLYGDEYTKSIKVPCYTLDSIIPMHVANREIDVLSIDTEGNDYPVLQGLDLNVLMHRPRLVIIEAHENHDDARRSFMADNINSYMLYHNYTKIYCDRLNNIYRDNYKKES